jgi:hypothetical protein
MKISHFSQWPGNAKGAIVRLSPYFMMEDEMEMIGLHVRQYRGTGLIPSPHWLVEPCLNSPHLLPKGPKGIWKSIFQTGLYCITFGIGRTIQLLAEPIPLIVGWVDASFGGKPERG